MFGIDSIVLQLYRIYGFQTDVTGANSDELNFDTLQREKAITAFNILLIIP